MKTNNLLRLVFLLVFCNSISCVHPKRIKEIEQEYGALLPVRIEVFQYVNHFTDSCKKAGIDTLIVFSTYYSGERLYPPIDYAQLGKKYSRGNYEAESFSTPSYIFWVHNGNYFLKKIDQFSRFKTVSQDKYQNFQLYDFYIRNQSLLEKEKELTDYPDTNGEKKQYTYITTSSPGNFYQTRFSTNTIYIGIKCDTMSFSKTIYKYKYQPLTQTTDSLNYHNRCGNDQKYYYENQQLKIYQWITLIESGLFDIESRKLWERE